ncbi:uncharacterized protein G2W53_026807 [Senna tora]|uniref:Uncharacterized protein n=1 Tax=Senna tora TaxID=362788 RepID=A0A834TFQ7_9FABA|nr:uncharacterized protein G2W53_026807 [Senna tora]
MTSSSSIIRSPNPLFSSSVILVNNINSERRSVLSIPSLGIFVYELSIADHVPNFFVTHTQLPYHLHLITQTYNMIRKDVLMLEKDLISRFIKAPAGSPRRTVFTELLLSVLYLIESPKIIHGEQPKPLQFQLQMIIALKETVVGQPPRTPVLILNSLELVPCQEPNRIEKSCLISV